MKKQIRHPVSTEQAERERKAVETQTQEEQAAVMLYVLRDKWGYGTKRLHRVWEAYKEIGNSTARMKREKILELIHSAGELTGDKRMLRWDPLRGGGIRVRDSVELRRYCNQGRADMRDMSMAITLLAMRKYVKFGRVRLRRLLGQLRDTTDSIDRHIISVEDITTTLYEEKRIVITE